MKLRKMGETHKGVKDTHTYRAMVTHLSLFDDIGVCRYVAQMATTKITTYTPVH
jgi:hypothetical protein